MSKTTVTAEPGKQDLTITRTFDAPRELVFKLYTDPDRVPQWWGPGTVVHEMEPRSGGRWRFVQRDDEGNEYAFRGVYHDITAPERVINTFEFEGMPGHVLLETITFSEENGKTTYHSQSVFQSVEDRDGMLMSGMEEGATASLDRLEALLAQA